ncbi:MAG: hypothetical protein RL696_425 [Actinomycetota bacterium]|jgi:hypothetical protein
MYYRNMSEWNYTKCSKPFTSEQEAAEYMQNKDLAGFVLAREAGFTAVCPTYPDGYYPDAKVVLTLENSKGDLQAKRASSPSCC